MAARPCHRTQAAPTPTRVTPNTAPTMACVADTGMAHSEAASRKTAPDNIAHAIPALHLPDQASSGRALAASTFICSP